MSFLGKCVLKFRFRPFFFLCYVETLENIFFTIISVVCHKYETRTYIKKNEARFP